MNKVNTLQLFGVTCFLTILLMSSCKSGLNERQKLFLDYAKLENKYNNSSFYHNLDLYNTNIEDPIYIDSSFNITKFKDQLKRTFKLVADGNQIETIFEGPDLQYPHEYIFKPQKDGSIHTSLSIFIPETYYKFSLDKSDIGKPIMKDSAEITLLDLTNDAITLLVENKGTRHSYDYTYDNVDKKDFNEIKNEPETSTLGYGKYLFTGERIDVPNSGNTTVKDSLVRTDYGRLNISLSDEHGKTLLSDGVINDFRHYLWYRNHDMPYPELASNYSDIRSRYVEKDVDPLHKFNPIDIVNIKANGKVDKVNFFLRSRKGHIETIDLGNQFPQQKKQDLKTTVSEFSPIVNVTKDNAANFLKINYTTLSIKANEPDHFALYVSTPNSYNNRQMSLTFEDIKLIGDKKDTVSVNESQDAKRYLNTNSWTEPTNFMAISFPSSNLEVTKIIGKVSLSTSSFYDKEFKINQLPKGMVLANDGLTLTIYRKEPVFQEMVEIYAFEGKDKIHPIPYSFLENATHTYSPDNFSIAYVKKPGSIVIRYKKADGASNQEVPFELNIPKKEK